MFFENLLITVAGLAIAGLVFSAFVKIADWILDSNEKHREENEKTL